MTCYLYIFEDGRAKVHEKPPTKTDLSCIANGTLQVFKSSHSILEVDAKGKNMMIDKASLVNPESSGESYHE